MKKHTAPLADKDRDKLRALLKVREAQFRTACNTLKNIVAFRSAHLSVFESEVHQLQQAALMALCQMENAQAGKKLVPRQLSDRQKLLYAKTRLNSLYGKFPGAAPAQREDEDV